MCIAVVQFLIPLVPNLVLIKMGLIYSYEHIRRALLDPFSSGSGQTQKQKRRQITVVGSEQSESMVWLLEHSTISVCLSGGFSFAGQWK